MNLKSGIFILVASAACLCVTESESNAQGAGGQLARRAVRVYAARTIPGFQVASIVRRGAQTAGVGQGFRSNTQPGFQPNVQRFGAFGGQSAQFGLRNGLQAGRLFRRR